MVPLDSENIKVWDLQKIIEDLLVRFHDVEQIYLFGSRAYGTNSKRSDIDLLISFLGNTTVDKTRLKAFQESYPATDIFLWRSTSASSIVNDSEILQRDPAVPLWKQLDAILLWDSTSGFCEAHRDYFLQGTRANIVFRPSYIPFPDTTCEFRRIVNNDHRFSPIEADYLKAAADCLEIDCYLGFISMLGAFYEELLIEIVSAYQKRVAAQFPALLVNYQNAVVGAFQASKRLIQFQSFLSSQHEEPFLSRGGIQNVNQLTISFDIIRRYRNEVDHPSDTHPNREICDDQMSCFVRYIKDYLDFIDYLKRLYP